MDIEFLRRLRKLGTVEAISTLVLFGIAMPLKYLAALPIAVQIVGPIHGVFFILFAVDCMMAVQRVPISQGLAAAGIACAVVPFGPFVFDRWLAALQDPA